ncbi:MAG: hypothetical protein AAF716_16110 [Cyanobacteria bacterium P01_D01_bin.1]
MNASGVVASQSRLPVPDVTIMSGYMAAPPKNDVEKTTRTAIRGLKTKELVWIDRGCTFADAEVRLRDLNYGYETATVFTHEQRAQIVLQITGADLATQSRDRKISTGLFAVCFALYQGASEVILSGISLSTGGYEYSRRPSLGPKDLRSKERKHVLPDQTAIAKLLDAKLPVKTSEKALSDLTGLPFVS